MKQRARAHPERPPEVPCSPRSFLFNHLRSASRAFAVRLLSSFPFSFLLPDSSSECRLFQFQPPALLTRPLSGNSNRKATTEIPPPALNAPWSSPMAPKLSLAVLVFFVCSLFLHICAGLGSYLNAALGLRLRESFESHTRNYISKEKCNQFAAGPPPNTYTCNSAPRPRPLPPFPPLPASPLPPRPEPRPPGVEGFRGTCFASGLGAPDLNLADDDDDDDDDRDDCCVRSGEAGAISTSASVSVAGLSFFFLFLNLSFSTLGLMGGQSGKHGRWVGALASEKPRMCPTKATITHTRRKNVAMAPKSYGVTSPTKGR